MNTSTGFWRREESRDAKLPLTGAVPDLQQAVVLMSKKKKGAG